MPFHMRVPKLKGFTNPFRTEYQVVNLDKLAALFPDGGEVNPDVLVERGAVRKGQLVKILGTGEISRGADRDRARVLRHRPGEDHRRRRHRHRPVAPTAPAACAPLGRTRRGTVGEHRNRSPDRVRPLARAGLVRSGGAVLTAFGRAFRTPDLRNKMLFTLAHPGAVPVRLDDPAPGVDYQHVHSCLALDKNNSVLALVNLFSGGALLQLTVFALGIMPYITSSIIIQLLVVVIPRLERLKEQGQSGQAKLTQYTRYLTVALAILQATGIVALARSGRLLPCTDNARQPDLAALLHVGLPDRHARRDDDGRHRGDHVARRADHRPRASATACRC